MKRSIICGFLGIVLSGSTYAQSIFDPGYKQPVTPKTLPADIVPVKPLPPKDQQARLKYDAAVAKAKADYEKAVGIAAKTYSGVLDQSLREVTRNGDLDTAIAIKAEKSSLETISGNLLKDQWDYDDPLPNMVTFDKVAGKQSMIINCYKRHNARIFQVVNVKQNTNYILSGLIRTKDLIDVERGQGSGGPLEDFGAMLVVNDTNAPYIDSSLINIVHSEVLSGTNEWKQVSIKFNSKERTTIKILAVLGGRWHEVKGIAAFTDIKLEEH